SRCPPFAGPPPSPPAPYARLGERDRGFRRRDVEAEALLQIQLHGLGVVPFVADRNVLAGFEHEVAATEADHDRASHARGPDDRALEDLAQVLEQRVAAVLSGLD